MTTATRLDIPAAVAAERLGLAALLDDLAPQEWDAPSLCAGWTVRHVVAHLATATRWTVRRALGGLLRHRGDLHGLFDAETRAVAAACTPAELVARLRETAHSLRRFPGASTTDQLVDVLVHAQDIARPLGRTRTAPVERVLPALEHTRDNPFFGSRTRLAGVRLVAADADWSAGAGPELRGPVGDLLLVATGREVGLAALTGPGVALVARAAGWSQPRA
jgi:uncharacterized protein (TIGR03083 family)